MKLPLYSRVAPSTDVTSYAEVWIEIPYCGKGAALVGVTSYAEVWIEMPVSRFFRIRLIGHLLRGGVD